MKFNRQSGVAAVISASIAAATVGCGDDTQGVPDTPLITLDASYDASQGTHDAATSDAGADALPAADAAGDTGPGLDATLDTGAVNDAGADATLVTDAEIDGSAPDAGDDAASVDTDAAAPEDDGGDATVDTDASPLDDAGDAAPTCALGSATSLATDTSLNLFGEITYFDDGAVLPAGHYQVQYVDGCMQYGSGQDWTVQAYANGSDAFWLVGASTADKIILPPGTSGYDVATGAYANFDDCVAANLALAPVDFDFAGGQIGVWLQDSPYSDNVAGVDGRNPKWSLTLLGSCVDTDE